MNNHPRRVRKCTRRQTGSGRYADRGGRTGDGCVLHPRCARSDQADQASSLALGKVRNQPSKCRRRNAVSTLKGAGNSIGSPPSRRAFTKSKRFSKASPPLGQRAHGPCSRSCLGRWINSGSIWPISPRIRPRRGARLSTALRLLGQPAENASAKTTDVEATAVSPRPVWKRRTMTPQHAPRRSGSVV